MVQRFRGLTGKVFEKGFRVERRLEREADTEVLAVLVPGVVEEMLHPVRTAGTQVKTAEGNPSTPARRRAAAPCGNDSLLAGLDGAEYAIERVTQDTADDLRKAQVGGANA